MSTLSSHCSISLDLYSLCPQIPSAPIRVSNFSHFVLNFSQILKYAVFSQALFFYIWLKFFTLILLWLTFIYSSGFISPVASFWSLLQLRPWISFPFCVLPVTYPFNIFSWISDTLMPNGKGLFTYLYIHSYTINSKSREHVFPVHFLDPMLGNSAWQMVGPWQILNKLIDLIFG